MGIIDTLQIGALALQALTDGKAGRVTGLTSKGLFLASEKKILFVTDAQYHSPFNLQIPDTRKLEGRLAVGDTWKVFSGQMFFETTDLSIMIDPAMCWTPSPPSEVTLAAVEQAVKIKNLIQRAVSQDATIGWLFVSGYDPTTALDPIQNRIRQLTSEFIRGVRDKDHAACLQSGRHILGLGGGLTPSGDDWVSGFLLYFNRTLQANAFIQMLGAQLTDLAYQVTTLISANRIEAACHGWAEELFLDVVDSVVLPQRQISDEQLQILMNFGHSSGVDTCVGIEAGILSLFPDTRN